MEAAAHYDEEYFAWQSKVGSFGGWAEKIKFESVVRPTDTVLDFGCGGGFVLKALDCSRRIGVEINPAARQMARRNCVEVFAASTEIPDQSVDVVISNHALEHVPRPLDELLHLFAKLKSRGRIAIVVPCEGIKMDWRPNVDQHLYTWAPRNLGNLLVLAGFEVEACGPFFHKWPPHYERIAKLGPAIFHLACRLYGRWETSYYQVMAVARKP
jgi:SAM-dependent methyltransferase